MNHSPTEPEPLLVPAHAARRLIGCGNTKFWQLVKLGLIEMTDSLPGRQMVIYQSLKRLAQPSTHAQ